MNNSLPGARVNTLHVILVSAIAVTLAPSGGLGASALASEALRPAPKPEASWPLTAADLKARAPRSERVSPKAAEAWAAEDRIVAEARCAALLKGLAIDYARVEPIKDGECGSPAPIEVRSIGKSPAVVLSPPAIVTCDMAAAMYTWLRKDLQPLARRLIGAPVIKVELMSSYSCRNAYGRAKTRLSEHGRANALDIRGFVMASGKEADLLADWGPTRREILMAAATEKAARTASEKAEQARRSPPVPLAKAAVANLPTLSRREKAVPAKPPAAAVAAIPVVPAARVGSAVAGVSGAAASSDPAAPDPAVTTGALRATIRADLPKPPGVGFAPSAEDATEDAASPLWSGRGRLWSFSPPSRLGGPKRSAPTALPINGHQIFLRKAHESACTIFGTVLGPEANNAHRNHFHVDMAERRSGNFCQ